MPGYQVYEYQLVLAIPESVRDRVRRVRQQFADQFPHSQPASAAILLPLVKFRQRQMLEQRVKAALEQLVLGWRPFTVNLKDYGALPTHSIYIPVTSKTALQQCTRELRSLQHLLRPDSAHSPYYPQEHQLLVATRLGPGVYEKAWQQYAHRHFNAQFLVDACLLLKRAAGEKHWQITRRFELRDLPVGIKQMDLWSTVKETVA